MTMSQSLNEAEVQHPKMMAERMQATLDREIAAAPFADRWAIFCDLTPGNISRDNWSKLEQMLQEDKERFYRTKLEPAEMELHHKFLKSLPFVEAFTTQLVGTELTGGRISQRYVPNSTRPKLFALLFIVRSNSNDKLDDPIKDKRQELNSFEEMRVWGGSDAMRK